MALLSRTQDAAKKVDGMPDVGSEVETMKLLFAVLVFFGVVALLGGAWVGLVNGFAAALPWFKAGAYTLIPVLAPAFFVALVEGFANIRRKQS